jgi:ABC-type polysaccharide/polyol phosphate export permease
MIRWNPLTHLVCSVRDIVLFGRLYSPEGFWISSGLSVMLFLFAWRIFHVSGDKIVERLL